MTPSVPSSPDQEDESCAPPPGAIGSTASFLTSSTTGREGNSTVTTATGSVITAGITVVEAAATLATNRGEASPMNVGQANSTLLPPSLIATCCRLGLHPMYMGGGEITRGANDRPLQKETSKIG